MHGGRIDRRLSEGAGAILATRELLRRSAALRKCDLAFSRVALSRGAKARRGGVRARLALWPRRDAQDADAAARSNSSIRMCSAPAPIPRDLPFSNEAGEGFENKIADLFAKKLGKGLAYTFYPDATGFIRNTLNAQRCDVVLGIAQEDDFVQPTNPYYRTAYVAAYAKDGPLAGLDSLSDPRLKTAKIGVIAGTPPVTYLAVNGLLGQHQVLRRWWSTRDTIRRTRK